jgi:hypothetical protein
MSTALDADKFDAFAAKMTGVLNHSVLALMTALGHRTGLFDAMARLTAPPPRTRSPPKRS